MMGMKKRYIRVLTIVAAAMVIIFAVQLINNRSLEEAMPLARLILITLASGIGFLPLALLSLLIERGGDQNQIMAVKEVRLSEQDLKDAASLWIYTQHGVAPEGEVELYVEEDGEISCSVHIPG